MTTIGHLECPKAQLVNIQMELTLVLHKIKTPNLLVIVVVLVSPLYVCSCVCTHAVCLCMCDARALFRQSPHKDFEYNLVWSAALEAIFCSFFRAAVLEIANQGVLAAI